MLSAYRYLSQSPPLFQRQRFRSARTYKPVFPRTTCTDHRSVRSIALRAVSRSVYHHRIVECQRGGFAIPYVGFNDHVSHVDRLMSRQRAPEWQRLSCNHSTKSIPVLSWIGVKVGATVWIVASNDKIFIYPDYGLTNRFSFVIMVVTHLQRRYSLRNRERRGRPHPANLAERPESLHRHRCCWRPKFVRGVTPEHHQVSGYRRYRYPERREAPYLKSSKI